MPIKGAEISAGAINTNAFTSAEKVVPALVEAAPPRKGTQISMIAELLAKNFKGRTSAYAIKQKNRNWLKVLRQLDQEVLRRHMRAPNRAVGMYPTEAGEDRSHWLAIDYDDHVDKDYPDKRLDPKVMERVVINSCKVLTGLGLTFFVCSSGGGRGVHVWVTFKEKVENAKLKALGCYVLSQTQDTIKGGTNMMREGTNGGVQEGVAEVFPKNKKVVVDGFGNLLALPLGRKSEPLDSLTGKPNCRHSTDENGEAIELEYEKLIAVLQAHEHNDPTLADRIIKEKCLGKKVVASTPKGEGKPKPKGKAQKGKLQLLVSQEGGDGRNTTVFKNACEARRRRMTYDDTLSLLVDENNATDNPLPLDELEKTVESAYKQDRDKPEFYPKVEGQTVAEAVDEHNETHTATYVEGKAVLAIESVCPIRGTSLYSLVSFQAFKEINSNQLLLDDEGVLCLKYASAILDHPDRATKKGGFVFKPKEDHKPDEINLFDGFPIKSIRGEGKTDGFHRLILHGICAGNPVVKAEVTKWLAHLFQRPWEMPGTALVLMGGQGTGKNAFVEIIGKLNGYFMMLTAADQVAGKFTAHLVGKLLLFFNEAIWGGDKANLGKFKSMITDSSLATEDKGVTIKETSNYARLIIASNDKYPVHLERDDRRMVILNVTDSFKEDHDFFGKLQDDMDNGGYEALMYELMHEDLTNYNPRKKIVTGFEHDLIAESATPTMSYLHHVLESLEIGEDVVLDVDVFPQIIAKSVFYNDFKKHCKDLHLRLPGSSAFFKEVYSLTQIEDGGRTTLASERVPVINLPGLAYVIPDFERKSGMKVSTKF
jgi:hypothetical protein